MSNKCPKCNTNNPDTLKFCGECGTQLPSLEDIDVTETIEAPKEELTTGATFAGRYQIIEELGKGGMGKVYKVHDTKIKEKIALKLIKPEIAKDKKTIERFSNELRLTRKIRHKNVCQMFDLGEDQGTQFITMEFVPGEDLRSLIRRIGQLPIGKSISIAKQICEGLTEAHRLGVVHRDLKSNNIMIDKEGNVRIMDFGIARSLEAKRITGAGVMIGTPEYMSPEQVEGKDVDQRSDIYSLGVILYEMVTGRVPFEGDTPLSIAVKHKTEAPQDPKELNDQLPSDLSSLILRCLEKDKEKRYQKAEEVLSELERIEKGIPTEESILPERKPITSKEITVSFNLKKLSILALAIIAVLSAAIIIWKPWSKRVMPPGTANIPSIAVLPFEDLSEQKDQSYICDGLAEELINRLTNIGSVRVPARTSTFSLKDKGFGINEIAEKLNVEMILEGSLRKAGKKLRIQVQLVNAADGFPVWSEKYERDEEDIFVLQDEISLSIADNLKIKLLGEEKAGLVMRHTQNPEAYNLFLKGLYFWNKRTGEDVRKAIDYFEKAIKLDTNYALAYARLADSYGILPFYTPTPPKEAFSKAKVAAMKALEIDETLAEGHSALGFTKLYFDWDWEVAEAELKRAIQIKPGYVTAHHWYAEYLTAMGRHEEAIEEIRRAHELDPLSLIINSMKAWVFLYARQYERAIEQCQKTLELDPNFDLAHSILGWAYLEKGMYEEAILAYQKRRGELGVFKLYAYALPGKRDESLGIIEEMKELWRQGGIAAYPIARVYAGLGEEDLVLEWLEKSIERREPLIVRLNVDPIFDSLCSNPRFKALLKKMNLE
ncbi:MAG: protein kinase [Candidatus Aminicenantes bacterium]|nr:protein kinase [Candidatus Aminicenantes bacterium]